MGRLGEGQVVKGWKIGIGSLSLDLVKFSIPIRKPSEEDVLSKLLTI